MSRYPRRAFLRGVGGVTIGLPFLKAGLAEAAEPPPRLLTLYFGNGLPPQYTAGGFTHKAMKPLEHLQQKLAVVREIEAAGGKTQSGHQHDRGSTNFARGRRRGASLDNVAYNHFKPDTLRDLLVAGISNYTNPLRAVHSFDSSNRGRPAERIPFNVFNYLFDPLGDLPGDSMMKPADPADAKEALLGEKETAERNQRFRMSVLDGAVSGYRHAMGDRSPYGSAVKALMRDHLDEVRELEKRTVTVHEKLIADIEDQIRAVENGDDPADPKENLCTKPDKGLFSQGKYREEPTMPCVGTCDSASGFRGTEATWDEVWPLLVDLTVMAMRCDVIRFGHLQNTAGGDRFTILNMGDATHEIGHRWSPQNENGFDRTVEWLMKKNAYLLDALDAVKEPNDKTLLDNSVVLLGTELGTPHNHSLDNLTFMVGGGRGLFKPGVHSFGNNASDATLYDAIAASLGIEGFGDPSVMRGSVDKIRA